MLIKDSNYASFQEAKGFVAKKNIIPLNLKQIPSTHRLLMANTHIGNALSQVLPLFIISPLLSWVAGASVAMAVRISSVIFGATVGSVWSTQFDARDFVLVNKKEPDVFEADDIFKNVDVLACNDGVVNSVFTQMHNNAKPSVQKDKPAGNYILIEHNDGETVSYSLYAHLYHGSIKVKVGDKVKRGQVIANVGDTGNSSHPHLHFQLYNKFGLFKFLSNFEPYNEAKINWKDLLLAESFGEFINLKLSKNTSGEISQFAWLT